MICTACTQLKEVLQVWAIKIKQSANNDLLVEGGMQESIVSQHSCL